MKSISRYLMATVVAGVLSLPVWAAPQEPQQQPQDSQQPQASQPQQQGQQPGMQGDPADSSMRQQAQTFTGKIVKSKDGVVLQDESTKTAYRLDDEKQAKKYAGKSVKVTGTLDSSTNTIHVSDVQLASSAY